MSIYGNNIYLNENKVESFETIIGTFNEEFNQFNNVIKSINILTESKIISIEESNILTESKIIDNIKSIFNKFIEFVKKAVKIIKEKIKEFFNKIKSGKDKNNLDKLKRKKDIKLTDEDVEKIAEDTGKWVQRFLNKLKEPTNESFIIFNESNSILGKIIDADKLMNLDFEQLWMIESEIKIYSTDFASNMNAALADLEKFINKESIRNPVFGDYELGMNAKFISFSRDEKDKYRHLKVTFSARKCKYSDFVNYIEFQKGFDNCEKIINIFSKNIDEVERLIPKFESLSKKLDGVTPNDSPFTDNDSKALAYILDWLRYSKLYIEENKIGLVNLINLRELYSHNLQLVATCIKE